MGIDIGWTILFTHNISKMYPSHTRLLRNVVKSYWVAHIFPFPNVTSWIRVHNIPAIIDIDTCTWFDFDLRSPSIFILQKNKYAFAIPVATTFAKYPLFASYGNRTRDSIFAIDLPYLLAKIAIIHLNYEGCLWTSISFGDSPSIIILPSSLTET